MQEKTLYVLLIVFFLYGCTGLTILSDHDSAIDFASYKSYTLCRSDTKVANETQPLYDNSLNRSRIKKAIEAEMNELGYQQNDSTSELLTGFHIVIKDRSVMTSQCHDFEYYQYWPECTVNTYFYTEGTLIIYVTDISKNQIIWQGSAEGILDIKEKDMEKVIRKTVDEIFEKYPLKKTRTAKKNGLEVRLR